jgi:hypothetical protein
VIEIAQDVTWDIAHHEPHDLVVDATLASLERVTDRGVESGR